jgi:hypothetical protein
MFNVPEGLGGSAAEYDGGRRLAHRRSFGVARGHTRIDFGARSAIDEDHHRQKLARPGAGLSSPAQDLHVPSKLVTKTVRFDLQIVGALEVQPEPGRIPKETTESQRRVRANRTLSVDDFVDASRRHA